jgi:quercetin dioxygenase-like cupin family protein
MATATVVAAEKRIRFGPGGGVYRIVTKAEESRPPLHTHANEDEYFLVLEGEITFYIDGRVIVGRPGEAAFVPRGAAHCFKNRSTRQARVLVLFTPGDIEGFFDFGLPINGTAPSEDVMLERLADFGSRFGLEVLGPSPL